MTRTLGHDNPNSTKQGCGHGQYKQHTFDKSGFSNITVAPKRKRKRKSN